jgi:putative PIN family toxin of toxin-antitoxin system
MIRVVFDTNILYSAIYQPQGLPAKAVDLAAAGRVLPCVSDAVLEEYREGLLRPELALHDERRRKLLELFSTLSLHVTPTERLEISADVEDNPFYECAAAAVADYIVTGNTKDFPNPTPHMDTQIVTARQLVKLIGQAEEEE